MNNLEQIRLAWSWGWAVIIDHTLQLVGIDEETDNLIGYFRSVDGTCSPQKLDCGKITGYLYAGQLAGSEPIPEGQRFRVKKTGEIKGIYNQDVKVGICLYSDEDDQPIITYDKSEIEPIFT